VAPAELEGKLMDHPLVNDVAVIGVEDRDQHTEVPRAYIVHAKKGGDAGDKQTGKPTGKDSEKDAEVSPYFVIAPDEALANGTLGHHLLDRKQGGKSQAPSRWHPLR
jgi:acyl-CoA synthetase (AMP-forming)/AMP-acid ligase II